MAINFQRNIAGPTARTGITYVGITGQDLVTINAKLDRLLEKLDKPSLFVRVARLFGYKGEKK